MKVKKGIGLWAWVIVFCLFTGMFTGVTAEAAEKKVAKVALGGTHSAAIDTEGGLWLWGSNESGAIGNGKKGDNLCEGTPIKIMSGVASVSLSHGSTYDAHSGAVTRDGSLYMWGGNDFGQLGDGTTTDRLKPKKIMDGVSEVVLGPRVSAAIKKDGSLWVWGMRANGVLGGVGTGNKQLTPVKLLDDVVQADFGDSHGAALKKDGSLWMWGHSADGRLGGVNGSKPEKVMDGVKQISLGHAHSGALTTDGKLYLWGGNDHGQIGDGGSERNIREPKLVMDDVAQFSLGQWASGIVKKDGSLLMCGYNTYISFNEKTPVKIADGAAVVELGDTHNAMIKKNGSLWSWGAGWRGQLGDGTVGQNGIGHDVKTPVKISLGKSSVKQELPKKGSTFTSSNITYRVTKSDAKKGTVTLAQGDRNKTSAVIPATVKKNGYTFKVTQISDRAFYNYTKLKKITIGKNVTSIGSQAFQGCKSLKTIQIKSTVLKKVGGNALSGIHKEAVIKVPAAKLGDYRKLLKNKGQASTVKIQK